MRAWIVHRSKQDLPARNSPNGGLGSAGKLCIALLMAIRQIWKMMIHNLERFSKKFRRTHQTHQQSFINIYYQLYRFISSHCFDHSKPYMTNAPGCKVLTVPLENQFSRSHHVIIPHKFASGSPNQLMAHY